MTWERTLGEAIIEGVGVFKSAGLRGDQYDIGGTSYYDIWSESKGGHDYLTKDGLVLSTPSELIHLKHERFRGRKLDHVWKMPNSTYRGVHDSVIDEGIAKELLDEASTMHVFRLDQDIPYSYDPSQIRPVWDRISKPSDWELGRRKEIKNGNLFPHEKAIDVIKKVLFERYASSKSTNFKPVLWR